MSALLTVFLTPVTSYADALDYGELVLIYQVLNSAISGTLDQQLEAMTGTNKWGTQNFTDFQTWGSGADNWQNVLNMAQSGGNSSLLGQEMQQIANQFPINTSLYNSINPNTTDQNFYALQSQTALAARAASQLGFDKIQDHLNYINNNLRTQIGTTADLKTSVDLQSRILVENTLVQLEMLRQLALSNQQQSIEAQAEANSAIKNANFLNPNNQ